jgi:hypothetical protein
MVAALAIRRRSRNSDQSRSISNINGTPETRRAGCKAGPLAHLSTVTEKVPA